MVILIASDPENAQKMTAVKRLLLQGEAFSPGGGGRDAGLTLRVPILLSGVPGVALFIFDPEEVTSQLVLLPPEKRVPWFCISLACFLCRQWRE